MTTHDDALPTLRDQIKAEIERRRERLRHVLTDSTSRAGFEALERLKRELYDEVRLAFGTIFERWVVDLPTDLEELDPFMWAATEIALDAYLIGVRAVLDLQKDSPDTP